MMTTNCAGLGELGRRFLAAMRARDEAMDRLDEDDSDEAMEASEGASEALRDVRRELIGAFLDSGESAVLVGPIVIAYGPDPDFRGSDMDEWHVVVADIPGRAFKA